jgi:hypothetical protein
VGCDYWAADLDNAENFVDDAAAAQFAVVVANPGGFGTAHVEVTINNAPQGDPLELEVVETHDIDEYDLYIFDLPRRDVDGENVTDGVDDGTQTWLSSRAFNINSDVPVVAFQFNPIDQQFSNDASLLFPTASLGTEHTVIGYVPANPVDWPMSPKNRSYITILGSETETTVEVTPSYDIVNGDGVPEVSPGIGIAAGTTGTFTIGPYDVLNLETRFATLADLIAGNAPDLTGSIVTADKPIGVFSGTDLAMIVYNDTEDSCCAEHLEQQVIPDSAAGYQFVVSHSAQRNDGAPEPDFYRVMALEDGTSVTTNLPSPDDSFTLDAGEYQEFFSTTGFVVDGSGPLHVAQFLVVGSDVTDPIAGAGDSSLLYVPAVDQRRGLYVFSTGEGFTGDYAVVSMPDTLTAQIDGSDVASVCDGPHSDGTLDSVIYVSYTCEIEDGVHLIHSGDTPEDAEDPIAVFVYGYYYAGSYAYPAGSNLNDIE